MGCCSHNAGGNSRGTETQARKKAEPHKGVLTKLCFRHWLLICPANTLSRGELTELESLSQLSRLFIPCCWRKWWLAPGLCCVCPFSDTLQFAKEDWHVVYPGKNICLECMLTLNSGMWDWKKTIQLQPWVLGTWNCWSTTAIISLPETECLMRKWQLERDCKYQNNSGRCSSGFKGMVCKGCLIWRNAVFLRG